MIETPRLRIEPFTDEHLTERYVGWLNDPEVVRYSDQRQRAHTLESCRAYMESFRGTPHHFWAIVARDPALGHIGNVNAYVAEEHRVADVGILVGERGAWGAGFGTEAWIAVCDHLLRAGGMRKVTAGTLEVNRPMLVVMQRAGMVPDGRRVRQSLFEGREVDVVHAALFADEWKPVEPGAWPRARPDAI
ncbi:MAG TPA: GNAT family N-acetyltransferase [Longimicrobiaceae bacterium]|nr:GNAT family N-acetyltransferase [Longimicrobiaceae bacterium]